MYKDGDTFAALIESYSVAERGGCPCPEKVPAGSAASQGSTTKGAWTMTDTSGVSGGSGNNGASGSSSNHDASSEASAQDAQSSASDAAEAASEAANASNTADAQAAADRAAAAADQTQAAADAAQAAAQANPTTENQAQAAAAQAQATAAQAQATAAQTAVDATVANATAQANPTADNVAAAQAAAAAASAAATAAISAQTAADALSNAVNGVPSAIAAAPIDLSISPSVRAQLTASPLDGLSVEVPGLLNAKGQLIDTCGQVVQSASVNRGVPADETDFAKTMEHLDRMVAGPISGPVYSASFARAFADGTLSAEDEKHLDNVHAVGEIVDGVFEHHQQRAEEGG
ncbi:hypothetical protein [Luteimonas salinilitoris]